MFLFQYLQDLLCCKTAIVRTELVIPTVWQSVTCLMMIGALYYVWRQKKEFSVYNIIILTFLSQ